MNFMLWKILGVLFYKHADWPESGARVDSHSFYEYTRYDSLKNYTT